MSKSTNRYGKVLLHATASISANPIPSPELKQQWAELDELSTKQFNKRYDALSDSQKTEIHYALNLARQQAKKEKKKAKKNVQKNGN